MDENVAISVKSVSKSFKLPHEKQGSLKGLFINVFKRKTSYETQTVLKNVSFNVKNGDFLGIVGRNGSGKSTLLKLLSEIYSPNKGSILINGKITPFIELGVGFNPELTGRENVFLNGALLGFTRKEMRALYDEIVSFAELEKFMDQKLKNYSSGMQVRLAFSIAIQAKSDILILDEVLAVGDEAFQQKCVDIFETYKAEKKTVVLVTHDMEAVRRFCNRAILIDKGKILVEGNPNKVASRYSELNRESISEDESYFTNQNKNFSLHINNKPKFFTTGNQLHVTLKWKKNSEILNLGLGIVKKSGEFIYGTNTFHQKIKNTLLKEGSINFEVHLDIGPGKYYLMAGAFGKTRHDVIEFIDQGPGFQVIKNEKDEDDGMVRLKSHWK